VAREDEAFKALVGSIGSKLSAAGKIGVSQKQDRTEAMLNALGELVEWKVLVGVPAEKGPRQDGTLNNAARAYILNFGSPAANIPAREFMYSGIADAQDQINEYFRQIARKAIAGDRQGVEKGLHVVGLAAQNAVRARINSNLPPPLAERTIRERRARGVTRTNTLVDTGQMRNAVTYVIRPK
jgi:hypothetical protein